MSMQNSQASNLWRRGKALYAQYHYKNGLELMEKAAELDTFYLGLLGRIYLDLATALRYNTVPAGDFYNVEPKKLWQRGEALLALDNKNIVNVNNRVLNLNSYLPKDEQPLGLGSWVPTVSWHRSNSHYKQYSMFAPIDHSKIGPIVEPDLAALTPLPVSIPKKILSLIQAFFWPCIIIIVIQSIVYLSMLFFSYLGDYMGWH